MIIRVARTEWGRKVDNEEEEKYDMKMCLDEMLIRPSNHIFAHTMNRTF